jgi:hypothetical protein
MAQHIVVTKFIISKSDYERMQDLIPNMCSDMSYEQFIAWNVECINELSIEYTVWLTGLCQRMKAGIVKLQDMESCAQFEADGFFFNDKKKLIIVNPR